MIGFWKLQVVQSGHFADLADRNRTRSIPIIAQRGPMLDREGRVLVDSYPSFSILLLRDDPKSLGKSLPQIEEGLGISHEDLQQELDIAKNEPKFQPVVIKPAAIAGGHRFRGIAPRGFAAAGTDDGAAAALPARRNARQRDWLRRRSFRATIRG